jgi:hypothetical protein
MTSLGSNVQEKIKETQIRQQKADLVRQPRRERNLSQMPRERARGHAAYWVIKQVRVVIISRNLDQAKPRLVQEP